MKMIDTLLLLGLLLGKTLADFGDYVDPTFNCPATTTCPQVCVDKAEDCPSEMKCEDHEMLCADGSCAPFCDPDLVSPCTSECASVACPKIITTYDVCQSNFTAYYDYANTCEADMYNDVISQGPSFTWSSPFCLLVYVWVIGVTFGIVAWCWYNHRINPVEGSCKVLQVSWNKDSEKESTTSQTGYKRHPLGIVLHWWTMTTYFGWMGLLVGVSYLYLTNLDDEESMLLSLKMFAVVWNVGLLWSFLLKFPQSIEAIFLRRCNLAEATKVAVYHEIEHGPDIPEEESICPTLQKFVRGLSTVVSVILTVVFAGAGERPDPKKATIEYCPVLTNPDGSRYFVFLFRRYNFDNKREIFVPGLWEGGKTFAEIAPKGIGQVDEWEMAYELASEGNKAPMEKYRVQATGLTKEQVEKRYHAVGPNYIDMVKPSFLSSFLAESTRPFYVYQFYILWIWITTQYWHMAIVNWGIIFITIGVVSWLRYQGAVVLFGLSSITGTATVLRDGKFSEIDQVDLVPGDTVKLQPGITYCDMLLLTGEAIVDESALTGEATPEAKSPIDVRSEEIYDPKIHKKKFISAGTKVLECDDALAVVKNTASYTTKGELLREMIAFRQYTPKLEAQMPLVVTTLVGWSTVLFFLVYFSSSDEPVVAWTLGMTAFANCFPALLPITFTVPVGISFNRLTKNKIACSNSDSILIAGKVCKAFFDKTGTLTKQGLDYLSCRSAESWEYGQWSSDSLETAMATCHCLSLSGEKTIIGNPVDRAMFAASKAKLLHVSGVTATIKDKKGKKYQVLRRFEFDHNTMTQSIIVRLPSGELKAIVKGSGENVSKLCQPSSLPDTYEVKLGGQAKAGVYQIAVAWKDIEEGTRISMLTRAEVESALLFQGVLNFSNQIREDTPAVIKELIASGIQPIMLTGDNLFTGIYIARKSGIIPDGSPVTIGQLDNGNNVMWTNEEGELQGAPKATETVQIAMSGEAWYQLLQTKRDYAFALAPSIHVVGRCSPHDKVSVVDTFVSLGSVTMMCGDGGNDCGALKAAHVGLALSDSDASIVAPFTALDKEIKAVLTLLKEGRAALASTLATYKYVVLYGQITSYNQLIMYYFQASFSEWMWTLIDGFWTVSFTLTLPLALPAKVLSKTRPTSSIFGWQTVSSVVGIMGIHFIFITIAFVVLINEEWYLCRKWGNNISTANILQTSDNYEITVIFLITGFQCLCSAVTMNFGYEFRRWWIRNWIFVLLALGFTFIHFWITLVPGYLSCLWRINCDNEHVVRSVTSPDLHAIFNPFNTTVMPESFRWKLIGIMVSNGVCVALYDYVIVNGIRRWKANKKLSEVGTFEEEGEEIARAVGEKDYEEDVKDQGPTSNTLTRHSTDFTCVDEAELSGGDHSV